MIKLIQTASPQPVTHITERIWLVLAMFAIMAFAFAGMRKGWKRRANRVIPQIEIHIPAGSTQVSPKVAARFSGTTVAGNWLDRITNQRLGTPRGVFVQVFNQGIFITDDASFHLWIGAQKIHYVSTSRGLAGDVVEKNGLLKITWQLGDLAVDTGVRVNRHSDHELIVNAVKIFPGKLPNAASDAAEKGAGA